MKFNKNDLARVTNSNHILINRSALYEVLLEDAILEPDHGYCESYIHPGEICRVINVRNMMINGKDKDVALVYYKFKGYIILNEGLDKVNIDRFRLGDLIKMTLDDVLKPNDEFVSNTHLFKVGDWQFYTLKERVDVTQNISRVIDTTTMFKKLSREVTFLDILVMKNLNGIMMRVEHLDLVLSDFYLEKYCTFAEIMSYYSKHMISNDLSEIMRNGRWYIQQD